MQWADVVKKRERKDLRQFAGLCLAVGAALVLWRLWRGANQWTAYALGGWFLVLGMLGVAAPRAIAWFYTAWMVAVFPIGWTISRLIIALMFFGVFTPVALLFRLIGRDALRVRRENLASFWVSKPQPRDAGSYLRQF
jgi:hypothetical protein